MEGDFNDMSELPKDILSSPWQQNSTLVPYAILDGDDKEAFYQIIAFSLISQMHFPRLYSNNMSLVSTK